MKNYLDIYTRYINETYASNISGVNITIFNNYGNLYFLGLTDENGKISNLPLLYFSQNSSNNIAYYSYIVNASIETESQSAVININHSQMITFNFSQASSSYTPSEDLIDYNNRGDHDKINIINNISNCTIIWKCSTWSDCINEKQTRICKYNASLCNNNNSEINKPETKRNCKIFNTINKTENIKKVLFDVDIQVLQKEISNLKKLSSKISLLNIGSPGKINVDLEYKIKDSNEKVVYEENEAVPVETQIEFIKEINISSLPVGKYKISANLIYEGQTEPAFSEDSFEIVKKRYSNNNIFFIAIISLIIFLLLSFFILYILNKKKSKRISNILNKIKEGKYYLDNEKIINSEAIYNNICESYANLSFKEKNIIYKDLISFYEKILLYKLKKYLYFLDKTKDKELFNIAEKIYYSLSDSSKKEILDLFNRIKRSFEV